MSKMEGYQNAIEASHDTQLILNLSGDVEDEDVEMDIEEDYENIKSEAEDAASNKASERSEEEEPEFEDIEIGTLPLLSKASGESILQLTELYTPQPSTQQVYEKQHLLERVTKASKKDKLEEIHNDYLRNIMAHKSDLRKRFNETRTRDMYTPLPAAKVHPLHEGSQEYRRRQLQDRLLRLERELTTSKLEEEEQTQTTAPEDAFYGLRHTNLAGQLVWELPRKRARAPGEERALCLSGNKTLQRNGRVLFINENEAEEDVREEQKTLLGDMFGDSFGMDLGTPVVASFSTPGARLQVRLKPQRGRPGHVKDLGRNPLLPETETDCWGEGLDRQQEYASFMCVERRMFAFGGTPELRSFPSLLNRELLEGTWTQLAHFEPTRRKHWEIHRNYSALKLSLSDNSLYFTTARPTEEPAAEAHSDGEESRASRSVISAVTSQVPATRPAERVAQTLVMLKHAIYSYSYPFLKRNWGEEELRNFHRPRFTSMLDGSIDVSRAQPAASGMPSRSEDITAYLMLKQPRALSLKEGPFILTEYVEQRPPLLQNSGMCSRLRRFFKGARASAPPYVGVLGTQELLGRDEQLPSIAQLREGQALAMLDNNLFRAPAYAHTARSADFVLLRSRKSNGKVLLRLRPVEFLYTIAQMEPRQEVFAPNARATNNFQREKTHAFIYKALLESNNRAAISEILAYFPGNNESNLKKQMKSIKCEQNKEGYWSCSELRTDQEVKAMLTPELLCEYESMLAAQRQLKDKGIHLTSIDKVPNAIQKLTNEIDDRRVKDLANYIEEELILTPWNLSASYIKTNGDNGMMRIEGLGDPTHGNGGYSFVRLPMKQPNAEKALPENDPSRYLPTFKAVTGTDADLRKLTKTASIEILASYGYPVDDLDDKGRWELVDILRAVASRKVEEGNKGHIEKFARGMRLNTKMQKDQCQQKIDEIFQKQVAMLGEIRDYRLPDHQEVDDEESFKRFQAGLLKEQPAPDTETGAPQDEQAEKQYFVNEFSTGNFLHKRKETAKPQGRRTVLKRVIKIPNIDGTVTRQTYYISESGTVDEYRTKQDEYRRDPNLRSREKKAAKSIEQKLFKIASKRDAYEHRVPITIGDSKAVGKSEGDSKTSSGAANISCGLCGAKGHMKTNRKKCPLWSADNTAPSRAVSEGIVESEGTKLILNIGKVQQYAPKKKEEKQDEYNRPKSSSSRRRRDALMANPYEAIISQLKRSEYSYLFLMPVKKEIYPDYYNIIKEPIDLQSMLIKAKNAEYLNAQSFIDDLQLLVDNSALYNGLHHRVTLDAKEIKEEGLRLLREKELLVEIPKE